MVKFSVYSGKEIFIAEHFFSGQRSAVSYSLLIEILLHMLVPYLAATPYLHDANSRIYPRTAEPGPRSPIPASGTQGTRAVTQPSRIILSSTQTVSLLASRLARLPALPGKTRSSACNLLQARPGMTKHISE